MSKKPPKGRSLAERNPDLAKQWHPDNEKTAKDVFPFTDEKYWWKCPEGDKWEDSTRNRSRGSTCTVCRSIAITHPHLAEEWHPTFNGDKKPEDFTAGMHEKIWWKCPKYPEDPEADDHVWYSTIKSRATGNESGCPICAGKKVVPSNCLAKTRDDIAKQWHPTFNGDKKPEDYTAGSDVMKYGGNVLKQLITFGIVLLKIEQKKVDAVHYVLIGGGLFLQLPLKKHILN